MCGIFGIIANDKKKADHKKIKALINNLFKFSQSRGNDSAGIIYSTKNDFRLLKRDTPARRFVKSVDYQKIQQNIYSEDNLNLRFIGHCRMVTNGESENPLNNQPVQKNNVAVVHNGIICNIDELWKSNPAFDRQAEVDSEIFTDLISFNNLSIEDTIDATKKAFATIEGSASIAMLSVGGDKFVLATNTGSLFYAFCERINLFLFASEKHILMTSIIESGYEIGHFVVTPMTSRSGLVVSTKEIKFYPFEIVYQPKKSSLNISIEILKGKSAQENLLVNRVEQIDSLRRCSKCILPMTFPFIRFNQQGVCNFCESYIPSSGINNPSELLKNIEKSKKRSRSTFDCIVPFSGGRDSSYGLHYLVKELNLKPITYTYDWGMVTDLARRNISRMCAALGVENILVSADIKEKRKNVHKNVSAWLKNPVLGIVPLFMAGDKQFLYYVNKIKSQTGVNLDIWMPNKLENTDFKAGFCGISPEHKKNRIDAVNLADKMRMVSFYGKEFLKNPHYLNSSLLDSAFAFFSYYFEPRNQYTVLFDYIPWREEVVNDTLVNNYNWETSPDTASTWRIGDGTASFYNYIYYTIAGFSEIDTFRSNQIREGMLDRKTALNLAAAENIPRYESIQWFLKTINVDFDYAIKTINSQKTLY